MRLTTRGETAAPRLGIHIRTGAGLVAAARRALELGCSTFQIMAGNPSAWSPGRLDPEEAARFAAFTEAHDLRPVFLHAGYLINLSCRTGRNASIYAKSISLLDENLRRAVSLGCDYVVVHLGSRRGTSGTEALAALAEGLGRLGAGAADVNVTSEGRGVAAAANESAAIGRGEAAKAGPVLLLENSAGAGDSVGSSFVELALILREAGAARVPVPLGICLDTAHLWGAGFDLASAAAARRVIDEFDGMVGVDRLHLIHLNDSPVARGSRRDRHEHIGNGVMSTEGLAALVRDPRLGHVAMIMETPGAANPSGEERMRDLRELAKPVSGF